MAYVPENYHPQVPHGVVIVLSAPGPVDRDKLAARWKAVCEERQLIVLAPMSAAADKWQPTETAFIRKTLDDVVGALQHRSDADRGLRLSGRRGDGLSGRLRARRSHPGDRRHRRRAAAADASFPTADPINRLAFFLAKAEKSPAAAAHEGAGRAAARPPSCPSREKSLGEQPRDLTADELAELARWIDTLDRI